MSEQENLQRSKDAYAAFSRGDVEAAMATITSSTVWHVGGDNALTGDHTGQEQIGALWAKLGEKGFTTQPTDFLASGDKVVVLTTNTVDGASAETADVFTMDADGNVVSFASRADTGLLDKAFPR